MAGTMRMLIGGQRDIRLMPINGYSRLVGYDEQLNLHTSPVRRGAATKVLAYCLGLENAARDRHRHGDHGARPRQRAIG